MTDMDNDWTHQQHDDRMQEAQECMSALKHARELGLSDEECMALAHGSGIANDFYREIRK